jgi:hypothetical protein
MFTRNFEILEMVIMAGCRISAPTLKDTIYKHDPSYTPKLKFSLFVY